MQALVRCVARFGLDGATLSVIAKESGLSRPLIRHHLGNREDIIRSLQDYVLHHFNDQSKATSSALSGQEPAAELVEMLFSETDNATPDMVLAFAALTQRSIDDPELRAACRASILEFEASVAQAIKMQFPKSGTKEIEQTAQGIVAFYFNATSLSPLDMSHEWHSNAKDMAAQLLVYLKDTK